MDSAEKTRQKWMAMKNVIGEEKWNEINTMGNINIKRMLEIVATHNEPKTDNYYAEVYDNLCRQERRNSAEKQDRLFQGYEVTQEDEKLGMLQELKSKYGPLAVAWEMTKMMEKMAKTSEDVAAVKKCRDKLIGMSY